jgi:hypothetical protein
MAENKRRNIGRIFGALLVEAVLATGAAQAQSAQTDYDHGADFSQYHTFSFYKGTDYRPP